MEAKLKDGSILHVDAEERIYAQSLPGRSVPIVIDQAEGERLLIEFAQQQQQEIERLRSQEFILNNQIETRDIDNELEQFQEAICISGKWKGYQAFWLYKGSGSYSFKYKSPDGTILDWLEDYGEEEDDSDWRIIAEVSPNPIK